MKNEDYEPKKCVVCGVDFYYRFPRKFRWRRSEVRLSTKHSKTCSKDCSRKYRDNKYKYRGDKK